MNPLRRYWSENKFRLITAVTILLAVYGLLNLYFILEVTSQSNDECLWTQYKSNNGLGYLEFQFVKEGGVSWNAGIRDGDHLIAIDGVQTKNTVVASNLLDAVRSGDYATYTVQRGDKSFETKVLVKKLINILGFAYWLLAFIWLIVGYLVYIAKPEGKTQFTFLMIGIYLVLFSSSSFFYRGNIVKNPIYGSFPILFTIYVLFFVGAINVPFAITNFFTQFPKPFAFTNNKWFRTFIIITPVALGGLTFFTFVLGIIYKKGNDFFAPLFNGIFLFAATGFIAGVIFLAFGYRRLKEKRDRIPILIILITYKIAIIAIIYNYFIAGQIAGTIFNNPLLFTPIILVALLPIAFGYTIFRYSLLDISEVVKVGLLYGTATLTLAAIYFILIYVVGKGIGSALSEDYQGVISGVVFVLFAVGFQSTKDRFQDLITEKFYPEQFAFQKVLVRFSNDVSTIVGSENILEWTKNIFVSSLRIQHFGIMLPSRNKNEYRLIRSYGIMNEQMILIDADYKINAVVINQLLSEKNAVIERQEFQNIFGEQASILIDEKIYTVIPIVLNSRIMGLMLFGLKRSGGQFAGKDMEMLFAAAKQIAVALENARLYESETEKKKLEHDLSNARKIQGTLLPREIPSMAKLDISGVMLPAQHVGGDYYDVIKVSDDEVFVVVGDVSGKGLSASLYMSKLQTMIRLYCLNGKTPKEILIEANKHLYADLEKNYFITVSLALFNTKTNTVKLCRAGHPPYILISDGSSKLILPGGMGLGLDKGEAFNSSIEEKEFRIKAGDLYAIYSDGVTEAMNDKMEEFGEKRLAGIIKQHASLPVKDIQKKILLDVTNFCGPTPQHDDITILLLKVSE
jgi:serine phosphatase RsbU (regulator of sigma subunit)